LFCFSRVKRYSLFLGAFW